MDAPDQHFCPPPPPRLIESIPQRCLVPPGSIRLSSVAAPAPPDCNQEPLQPYRLGFEVRQSAPPALGSFVSQIKSVPSCGLSVRPAVAASFPRKRAYAGSDGTANDFPSTDKFLCLRCAAKRSRLAFYVSAKNVKTCAHLHLLGKKSNKTCWSKKKLT